MQTRGILVHYAELGTKGHNKKTFIKRLMDDVRRAVPEAKVELHANRLWLYKEGGDELAPEVLDRLAKVPGLANFAPAWRVPLELETIKRAALELVRHRTYATFRVRARRVFKELPYGSVEVDHAVGGFLLEHKPAKVRLKGADLEVGIEMLPEGAFLYTERRRGLGGLPLGTGGVVACMMSGGIDSPVAAFRMMRRGCRVVLVHFHSHPFLSRASAEKALELAGELAHYQGDITLYLVPFGELQREVVASCPTPLRVVIYRRFMVRIAARLAVDVGAGALVTGEALGQVASQTLRNMAVIDEASPLLLLRPLVGFDKQEIIDEAKRIGTYETSILPDQDCCTLFVPPHPETQARLDEVLAAEQAIDGPALIEQALARIERHEVRSSPAAAPLEASP
jgi:tRNA uracil 4-sulfurtransferase